MRHSYLNRFISGAVDHVTLSLCWLVGCLPVVTVPVATAALFEVVRLRGRGEEPAIGRSFLVAFRQYLPTALPVGFGWAALGGLLAADLLIVAWTVPPAGGVLQLALVALLLLYLLGSVALFPVLVSYHAPPGRLVRTAVLVALRFPGRSLLGLAAVTAAVVTGWAVPLTIVITPSLVATAVQRAYRDAFARTGTWTGPPLIHPTGRTVAPARP